MGSKVDIGCPVRSRYYFELAHFPKGFSAKYKMLNGLVEPTQTVGAIESSPACLPEAFQYLCVVKRAMCCFIQSAADIHTFFIRTHTTGNL